MRTKLQTGGAPASVAEPVSRHRPADGSGRRQRTLLGTAAILAALALASVPARATSAQSTGAPVPQTLRDVAASTVAPQTLRVCADPDNLPFSSAEGARHGVSLDIAQLVADALGRRLEPVWTVTVFGKRTLRTTLLAGQCDIFVGLPETTDFMGKRVIYSRPLFTMGYALAVPAGRDVRGFADLDGLRVGVQYGTPPQSLLATRPGVTPVTFMDPGTAMAALSRGDVDAAFVWGPVAGYIASREPASRFHVVPVAGADMQWPVGIGFDRANTALRDEVDRALGGLGEQIGRLTQAYGLPTEEPVRFAAAQHSLPAPRFLAASRSLPASRSLLVLAAATTEEPASGPDQLAMAHPTAPIDMGDTLAKAVEGRTIFNTTCAHCHGPDAKAAVARINLTLLKRRYGEKMDDTFVNVVTHGRPSKGMPNWSGILSDDDITKINAFLHTVQQGD